MTTEKRSAGSDPRVLDALRQVVDPELGVNIVDLGLVYGSEVWDGQVHVAMTMTTPACPMEELLMEMGHSAILRELPEAGSVDVGLVWDPVGKLSLIHIGGCRRAI